jgi:hypothetical protein
VVTEADVRGRAVREEDGAGRVARDRVRVARDGVAVALRAHVRVPRRLQLLRRGLVVRGRLRRGRGCGRRRCRARRARAGAADALAGLQEDIEDGLQRRGLHGEALDLGVVGGIYAKGLADALD